jgi:3-oxoacyl-[acyl-carrier protein] reductase
LKTEKPDSLVIAITGTSRGLGRNLAEHYLKQGCKVAGSSRGERTIEHPHYHHTTLDIGNEKDVRSWGRGLKKEFGRVDALINNAGLVYSALLLPLTPGDVMESFLRTNIAGVFYVLREMSKLMMTRQSGRIITISSTMVALHEEGTAVYSATKSAVTEMTKILAKELVSKGITCNIIAPAMMWTDSSQDLAKGGEWKEKMLEKQTIPRIIEMEEVCHVADFFISPMSGAITGQVVYLGLVD